LATCKSVNGFVPATYDYIPGCAVRDCCIINRVGLTTPVTSLVINSTTSLIIDEIRFMGYADEAVPLPVALQEEIANEQNSTCVDELFFSQVNIQACFFPR
jgi:hypothetical protein